QGSFELKRERFHPGPWGRDAAIAPFARLPAGFPEDPMAEGDDQAVLLRRRNELGRRDDAAPRGTPPRERFHADDAAGGDFDLGLVLEEELPGIDGDAQLVSE